MLTQHPQSRLLAHCGHWVFCLSTGFMLRIWPWQILATGPQGFSFFGELFGDKAPPALFVLAPKPKAIKTAEFAAPVPVGLRAGPLTLCDPLQMLNMMYSFSWGLIEQLTAHFPTHRVTQPCASLHSSTLPCQARKPACRKTMIQTTAQAGGIALLWHSAYHWHLVIQHAPAALAVPPMHGTNQHVITAGHAPAWPRSQFVLDVWRKPHPSGLVLATFWRKRAALNFPFGYRPGEKCHPDFW
jgi:hypothetical protein